MFRPSGMDKDTVTHLFPRCFSITLVPALMPLCLRANCAGSQEPAARRDSGHLSSRAALEPETLEARHRAESWPFLVRRFRFISGSEANFMPALYEVALYMPSALPGISITQASRSCRSRPHHPLFPEVSTVRYVGRSDRRHRQRAARYVRHHHHAQAARTVAARHDLRKLIHDMDEKAQFPGLTNTWTMPVRTARYGVDRNQDRWGSRSKVAICRKSRYWSSHAADSCGHAGDQLGFCRTCCGRGYECGSEPARSRALRPHRG